MFICVECVCAVRGGEILDGIWVTSTVTIVFLEKVQRIFSGILHILKKIFWSNLVKINIPLLIITTKCHNTHVSLQMYVQATGKMRFYVFLFDTFQSMLITTKNTLVFGWCSR